MMSHWMRISEGTWRLGDKKVAKRINLAKLCRTKWEFLKPHDVEIERRGWTFLKPFQKPIWDYVTCDQCDFQKSPIRSHCMWCTEAKSSFHAAFCYQSFLFKWWGHPRPLFCLFYIYINTILQQINPSKKHLTQLGFKLTTSLTQVFS